MYITVNRKVAVCIRISKSNPVCMYNWLKNLGHFFIQSQVYVQPKPIITCAHTFLDVLHWLHVVALCFVWFSLSSVSFVIG